MIMRTLEEITGLEEGPMQQELSKVIAQDFSDNISQMTEAEVIEVIELSMENQTHLDDASQNQTLKV